MNITVAANATTSAQANGAGIDVAGAGVEFRYNNTANAMTLNTGLSMLAGTGNLNVAGNIIYTQPTTLSMDASSVQPKYYVDVMTVVFGT